MQNIKVVFVGDSQVGKSYLLNSCAGGRLEDDTDNHFVIVTVDNTQVNVSLWDSKGSADYDRLRPLSYPCTEVFFLCFSLVSHDSLEILSQKFLPEVRHQMPGTTTILVGTKKDMRDDPQVLEQLQEKPVSTNEGKRKAIEMDAYGYVECSAITGEGTQELLEMAVRSIIFPADRRSRKKKRCIII